MFMEGEELEEEQEIFSQLASRAPILDEFGGETGWKEKEKKKEGKKYERDKLICTGIATCARKQK